MDGFEQAIGKYGRPHGRHSGLFSFCLTAVTHILGMSQHTLAGLGQQECNKTKEMWGSGWGATIHTGKQPHRTSRRVSKQIPCLTHLYATK